MGLKIYLDDCAFSYRLRQLLLDAGHQVQVPADVDPPLTGLDDAIHFAHVQATDQLILTYNPADFQELQHTNPTTPVSWLYIKTTILPVICAIKTLSVRFPI